MNPAELRVLIAEDHEIQRKTLEAMLRGLGVETVYAADNGRAALDLLQSVGAVDVLITDLDMPVMDGMELIRHVAAHDHAASVIVVSAMERSLIVAVEAMSAAYGIRLLGFAEKPVTPHKLQALVARYKRHSSPARHAQVGEFTLTEIEDGLRNDEFEAFFQPQVEVRTGRAVGVEALARWRRPGAGIVTPYAFIKPLEDAGTIDELLWCVLRKSARFARTLRAEGLASLVSVNISPASLHALAIGERIAETIENEGVSPGDIVLEITESASVTALGTVLENLSRLRMKGFELSIDDYGTGYSSLEQLARIPFTEVKIDQSFVTHADQRAAAKVILESSLAMARRLGLRAVAEGVETQANWDLLRELGCAVAQGYYIGRPMSADDCIAWMQSRNSARSAAR